MSISEKDNAGVRRDTTFRYGGHIGFCGRCGTQLTRCGIPFTLDVECHKCHIINVYKDSRQPVALKQSPDGPEVSLDGWH